LSASRRFLAIAGELYNRAIVCGYCDA